LKEKAKKRSFTSLPKYIGRRYDDFLVFFSFTSYDKKDLEAPLGNFNKKDQKKKKSFFLEREQTLLPLLKEFSSRNNLRILDNFFVIKRCFSFIAWLGCKIQPTIEKDVFRDIISTNLQFLNFNYCK